MSWNRGLLDYCTLALRTLFATDGRANLCGHHHLARDHHRHVGLEHPSSRGRGLRGFENGDRGLDHVGHNHVRGDRLFEGNNHPGLDEEGTVYVRDGESAHDGHLNAGHGQNQNARMLKVAYGPTEETVSLDFIMVFNRTSYFNL